MTHASMSPAQADPPVPAAGEGPDPGTRSRRRQEWLLILGGAVLVGAIVVLANLPATRTPGTGAGATEPPLTGGYLTSTAELKARGLRADAGLQPDAAAVAQLLADADAALVHEPSPVGLLVITGDDGPFVEDAVAAYGLALAWGLTGDARYGQQSAAILRAWRDSLATIGDTCPDTGACHTSLIVSRTGAGFVFAADLLDGAPFWTPADRRSLATWLTGVVLPAASERTNNWGDAGTLLRVAITDYAGDRTGFQQAVDRWRALMDLVTQDGEIPEETRRGIDGMQYTQEALQYKVAVAEIASRRGIDLWSYRGAAGGSLQAAVDALAWYWFHPDAWPWYPAVDVPSPGPMWELAYAEWRNPAYLPILEERRPYGDLGHSALRWTTLTSGVPGDAAAAGSASASALETLAPSAAAPTPTATPEPSVLALGTPVFRIAGIGPGDQLDVRVSWPIDGDVPDGTRITVAVATTSGYGPPATVAPGHSVPIRMRVGEVTRIRAAVVDSDGVMGPWVEAAPLVARSYDDGAAAFAYAGTWTSAAYSGYIGGTAASSDRAGATATLSLDGVAVLLVGPTGPTRGRATVTIDGSGDQVIDLRSSRFVLTTEMAAAAWPAAGPHTVAVEVLGEPSSRPTVAVDAAFVLELAP